MRDINNKISWLLIGIDLTLLFVLSHTRASLSPRKTLSYR